jgi:hypothetical protein
VKDPQVSIVDTETGAQESIGEITGAKQMNSAEQPTRPEEEKLRLEIEKLQRENAKLDREGRWSARAAAVIVPQITAIVAILGVVLSLYTLREQGRARTEEANEKAFQQALTMATDPAAGSDRRISGIYQLRRFWSSDREAEIVAATIASLLLLPDTVPRAASVRCAAADAVNGAYDKTMAASRNLDVPRLLYGKADTGALGLISYQNYLLRQRMTPEQTQAEEASDTNRECATPMAATREAIRKGWPDLRNTNLQSTDLDGALLYQADLHGANLSFASLNRTSFRCANLSDAHLEELSFYHPPDVLLANVDAKKITRARAISRDDNREFSPRDDAFLKQLEDGAIELSDSDWQKWKASGFDGKLLKELLHGTLPFALTGRQIEDVRSLCIEAAPNLIGNAS